MGLVDTIIVGPLGPAAIGAVGIGSILFLALAIFGMGLLLGLDTLVSHAYGAGHLDECHRWLLHGVWLSLIVAPVLTAVAWRGIALLPRVGLRARRPSRCCSPTCASSRGACCRCSSTRRSAATCRRMGIVRPVTFALVSANVINAVAAWALVFGHLGAAGDGHHRLGGRHALLAHLPGRRSCSAAVVWHDRRHHVGAVQRRAGGRSGAACHACVAPRRCRPPRR